MINLLESGRVPDKPVRNLTIDKWTCPDRILSLLTTETNTLLVYENTMLK
jgi:hypothetical protein